MFGNYSFETAVESWRECLRLLKGHKSELPEWLPSSEQWHFRHFFASVNLVPANEADDCRYEYLNLSLGLIPGGVLKQFSSPVEYLKWPRRRFFSASFFILSNESELETLTMLLPQSSSAIVDMTTYTDDIDSAIRHLHVTASGMPVTFLVTHKHAKTSALIATMPDCLLVNEIEPLSIAQEFSLEGYPAAYLELAERHMRFSSFRMKSGRLARLSAVPYVIADRYARWKGRFKTVFIWISRGLGIRRF